MSEFKLSYYLKKEKEISIQKFDKEIRVAILSSFTINGLQEVLRVKCANKKILCHTYVSGYNQYNQEILDAGSKLYSFKPDFTFLILDVRSILGDLFFLPNSISVSERKNFVENKVMDLYNLVNSFVKSSDSKLVISNLNIPNYSPYGIYEFKDEYGLKEMIQNLNNKLVSKLRDEQSVYIYDFNGFVNRFGEENIFDYRQYFFGDVKISLNFLPYLGADFMGYLLPALSANKKCIVVDLDNTLWGGIVGEDGFNDIQLGPNRPGNAFVEFQKCLLALHQRGIILAVNSRNNLDDAMQVINEHPHMVLRDEHFACYMINWNDKISNMKEIAKELNIGLDSIVYFDDDPINREIMKKAIPEVQTVDLPNDPSLYAKILKSMQEFNVLKITKEDIEKGKMYLQQRHRSDFKGSTNLNDYLKGLGIKVKIRQVDDFSLPRVSQLTLKTNQFNLTTRRYQEEEIRKFKNDRNVLVGYAQVEDKFGDNGITGVYIIKKEKPSEWLIDTFLLSCRVMGRGVENTMLSNILKEAKNEGVTKVKGEFIPTKKNRPCENFFPSFGFVKNQDYWEYNSEKELEIPEYIQVDQK